MWSCGERNPDGSVTIPADKVERLERQMKTAFTELPDVEKASDFDEADKILKIVELS